MEYAHTPQGHVGINTDKPEEALSVNGNIRVSGRIMQPSDMRVKKDIRPVSLHLSNRRIRRPACTCMTLLHNPHNCMNVYMYM